MRSIAIDYEIFVSFREYGKPDGVKLSVTFDALNRISGKHRALFSSFLGEMRYFDVDLAVRKLVINRLGQLLRNFRRKLRQTYILPNQDTPSKLNKVPAKYSAILKVKDWVNFVNYMATKEYKVKSAKAKMARSKCVFSHTMGRGGYAHVKEKMKETEDKIKEGTFQVDQGTDVMTLVLGKEKGGYARGVGSKVTYKRYFDLPRSKQAADERILLLESQLDAARREREEKELLIKSMSSKMSQTEGMVTKLKNQLAAQGGQLQSTPTQLTPLDVSPVEIHPINSSADEEGGTTVLGCDQNDASIRKEMQKRAFVSLQEQHHPSTYKCHSENKTATKVQTKRKNVYVSSDAMQKEANKKRSQKALVY
ncbi:hypothetical protein Tco_1575970 [Tanacetum coccineum]